MLHSARDDLTPVKRALAVDTADRSGRTGALADALAGADVYIGVSGGTVPEEVVATMAAGRDHLRRWPTRRPRCTPTSRTGTPGWSPPAARDFPNQINNVLAFPGIFRGAFDVRATAITEGMKLAAADALAGAGRRRPARGPGHPVAVRPAGRARPWPRRWPRPPARDGVARR